MKKTVPKDCLFMDETQKMSSHTERTHETETKTRQVFVNVFLPKHSGVKKQEALRQLKSKIGGLDSPQTLFCFSFVKP